MTARTAVTTGLIKLTGDTSNALGAGQTPDASNGNTVPAPGPFHARILAYNGDSVSHTITVRATGNGVTASGAAQTSPAPSNTVSTQSTLGDLTATLAATSYYEIGPLTGDRFSQADGSLSIDWSASTSIKFWVIVGSTIIPS